MDTPERLYASADEGLEAVRQRLDEQLRSLNPLLDSALRALAAHRGKMLRPRLCLLAAAAVGSINERVIAAATTVELMHTATLVHDDIVDESDQRRGAPSTRAQVGNKAAVLVGDHLLALALQEAARTRSTEFIDCLADAAADLASGELTQLRTAGQVIGQKTYEEIIYLKTVSLFHLAVMQGAMLATPQSADGMRDFDSIDHLLDFARHYGLAFQMRDDLLDLDLEHAAAHGKPAGQDLRERHFTLPAILALYQDHYEDTVELTRHIQQGTATEAEIAEMVHFIGKNGTHPTRRIINEHVDIIHEHLDQLPDTPARDALRALADQLTGH